MATHKTFFKLVYLHQLADRRWAQTQTTNARQWSGIWGQPKGGGHASAKNHAIHMPHVVTAMCIKENLGPGLAVTFKRASNSTRMPIWIGGMLLYLNKPSLSYLNRHKIWSKFKSWEVILNFHLSSNKLHINGDLSSSNKLHINGDLSSPAKFQFGASIYMAPNQNLGSSIWHFHLYGSNWKFNSPGTCTLQHSHLHSPKLKFKPPAHGCV